MSASPCQSPSSSSFSPTSCSFSPPDLSISPIDAALTSTTGQLSPVAWSYGPCNQISSCSSSNNPLTAMPTCQLFPSSSCSSSSSSSSSNQCLTLTPNGWSANQFNPTSLVSSGTAFGSSVCQSKNALDNSALKKCVELCKILGETVGVANDVPLIIPADYAPNSRPFSLNRLSTKTCSATSPTIENVMNGLKLKAGYQYIVHLSFESFHKTTHSWARIAVLLNKQVVGCFNPITVSMGKCNEVYPTYYEFNRFIQATEDVELTVMPLAANNDTSQCVELTNVLLQATVVGMIQNVSC